MQSPPASAPGTADPRRGRRPLLLGWCGLVVLSLADVAIAPEMSARFGGGPVRLRPWMVTYNLVVLSAHLAALSAVLAGAWLVPAAPHRTGLRGARLLLGAAIAAVAAMMALPLLAGTGPWAPDAVPVRALRALVFLPFVLRGAAWALLARALAPPARSGWLLRALHLLLAADLLLVVRKWALTPAAVTAVLHPCAEVPALLAPWLAGSALFLAQIAAGPGTMTRRAGGPNSSRC